MNGIKYGIKSNQIQKFDSKKKLFVWPQYYFYYKMLIFVLK